MLQKLTARLLVAAAIIAAAPAVGQEPDLETLELAAEAVEVSGTRQTYDEVLPNIADSAKTTFIRANPQIQLGIIDVVDRVALELVHRRRDLDARFAQIWASAFTKEDLQALIEFYKTPTGQRFAERLPRVLAAQLVASQRWSDEVSEELGRRVGRELRAMVDAEARSIQGDEQSPQQ